MMESGFQEPYKIFFPLGIMYGIWGAGLWLLQAVGFPMPYPAALHSLVMMGGFLGAFAFGFLTTAVPRMTRSFPLRRSELIWILTPLLILPVISFSSRPEIVAAALALAFSGMIKFAFVRYRGRKAEPPDSFVFVGLGLVGGFTGLMGGWLAPAATKIAVFGRLFFLHGFIASLVLGVGSRLVPALLGRAPLPGDCSSESRVSQRRKKFLLLAGFFLISFFVEVWGSVLAGKLMRAAIMTWITMRFWMIWRWPIVRSIVSWLIWVASWFCLIGSWGGALLPSYAIHFFHLEFISGFGVLTLMIATRVVLAHGGFNLILESRLKILWWIGLLIISAALARLAAGFQLLSYSFLIGFASMLWILGLSLFLKVPGSFSRSVALGEVKGS